MDGKEERLVWVKYGGGEEGREDIIGKREVRRERCNEWMDGKAKVNRWGNSERVEVE